METMYRGVFNAAPTPMWLVEPSTLAIIEANEAAIRRYGFTQGDFQQLTLVSLEVGDAATSSGSSNARRHRTKDGREIVMDVCISPLGDNSSGYCVAVAHDVTPLHEGNEKLLSIIASLDEVIVEADRDGVIIDIWANDEARLVKPREQQIGRPLHDIMDKEAADLAVEKFREVIETKSTFSSEHDVILMGEKRWYQQVVCPVIRSDGTCVSVTILAKDVTERRQTEESLKAFEARYTALLERINEIVFAIDNDKRIQFVNPAWHTVTGYTVEDSLQCGLLDHVLPDDRPSVEHAFASIDDEEHASARLAVRFIAQSGNVIWLDLSIQRSNPATDGVNGYFGTIADITERKLAVESIKAEREFLRSVIDTDPNLIFVKGADGRYLLANRAMAECYGTTVSDIVGKLDTDFSHTAAESATYRFGDLQVLDTMAEKFIAEENVTDSTGSERCVQTVKRPIFDPETQAYGVLGICSDITERKRFEKQLAHQAFHDSLTNLPNRALFMERVAHGLGRATRRKKPVAVVFLDLDNFKLINDSLGHEAGDALLISVAERLGSSVRPGDTVARLGGDEFTILLEDLNDESEVLGVVERIAELLKMKIRLGDRDVSTSASVGIAVSNGEYDSPDALLRDADTAMYEAKTSGKAHSVVFDLSMNARAVERLEMEIGMRHAVERGEFVVFYQPIVHLETGRITGAEALVRWNHPTKGLLLPAKFITIAEETRLIIPIGQWVIEQACRQTVQWQREYPQLPPFCVSVNLSTVQLQQKNIVNQIAAALEATGLEPCYLKLELTESVMIQDRDDVVAKLVALEELGVKIAVDDFGTGYSSMAYLSSLPLDTLKIDRSFIDKMANSPADTSIVRAIVSLAKSLKLRITCEGIETIDQLNSLKALGCDQGQGYFLSCPVPSGDFTQVLAKAHNSRRGTKSLNHPSAQDSDQRHSIAA